MPSYFPPTVYIVTYEACYEGSNSNDKIHQCGCHLLLRILAKIGPLTETTNNSDSDTLD
jgi:hypothetical protein